MTRILVDPPAQEEIREARRRHGLRFRQEFTAILRLLRTSPQLGPPCPTARNPMLRHRLLERCQYYMYYLYEPPPADRILLLSIWSTARGEPPHL